MCRCCVVWSVCCPACCTKLVVFLYLCYISWFQPVDSQWTVSSTHTFFLHVESVYESSMMIDLRSLVSLLILLTNFYSTTPLRHHNISVVDPGPNTVYEDCCRKVWSVWGPVTHCITLSVSELHPSRSPLDVL